MKKALVNAANGGIKKKNSFYQAKCNKLTMRLGSRNKAKVAIANTIARTIYYILRDKGKAKNRYKELGATRVYNQKQQIKNYLGKLKSLGVEINYHEETKIFEAKKEFISIR